MMMMVQELAASGKFLTHKYRVWLCDVWGVVHNGVRANEGACQALIRHRENGGIVILLTNAPRPEQAVQKQLDGLQVPRNAYDGIVTSGDVTRALVSARKGGNIFFLGPDRDFPLKEGLPVNWTDWNKAQAVLCTGLYDDKTETADDYTPLFKKLLSRNLPMICANPDLVVQFDDRLIPCAGALAAHYEEMGGTVEMAGKPYQPIYDIAVSRASQLVGQAVPKAQMLAIGDGLKTDIAGAANFELDVAFVTGGIHDGEIGHDASLQDMANIARQAVPDVKVVGAMRDLCW